MVEEKSGEDLEIGEEDEEGEEDSVAIEMVFKRQ